jgi:hypothetical protein
MSIKDVKKMVIYAIIVGGLQLSFVKFVFAEPTMVNPGFTIERIFARNFEPSSMTFLGPDDILILDRDEGKVYRINHGIESGPLLDVNVATDGYRGLLGVVASTNKNESSNLFLYFTEARRYDGADGKKLY